jgi:hypothetical protein
MIGPLPQPSLNRHFSPEDGYVSPKRWNLPTSIHGAKTQNNIIVFTVVKTSTLIKHKMIMTSCVGDGVTIMAMNWKGGRHGSLNGAYLKRRRLKSLCDNVTNSKNTNSLPCLSGND